MAAAYPRRYEPTRPAGVTILAFLMGLVGVLLLIVSIAGIVLFTGLALLTQFHYFGAGALASVLLFIFSIVLVVVAVGLWRLELWALAVSAIVLLILLFSAIVQGNLFSLS
ncbi:MAG: hypothetical protein L3J91_04720, partial [Thermoplasmata archaeon]|nr:hypothetical protein [Thermoplasmata archaeon]